MSNIELQREYVSYLNFLKYEGVVLSYKESWRWKLLDKATKLCTLGRNTSYLTSYASTYGKWIGLPSDFDTWSTVRKLAVLKHEKKHADLCRLLGLGSYTLGIPLYSLIYILPIPFFFAYGRYLIERSGFLAALHVYAKYGTFWLEDKIHDAVEHLVNASYAFTMPRSWAPRIERYFRRHLAKEESGSS